jgi:hypothetical protein
MKITDIEDGDRLVTKDYWDARLSKLELGITDRIIASERGQRMWIGGLYALVIASTFGLGSILFNLQP